MKRQPAREIAGDDALRISLPPDSATTMFNDTSSPLSLFLSRRSGKPRDMVSPGPDTTQMDAILAAATRVPDHGKLAPWRFVTVGADQRDALSALLVEAYRAEKPDAGKLELDAMDQFARQAPSLVVALSSPKAESKIPLWEQELSVGAACMQLLNAVHAQGCQADLWALQVGCNMRQGRAALDAGDRLLEQRTSTLVSVRGQFVASKPVQQRTGLQGLGVARR